LLSIDVFLFDDVDFFDGRSLKNNQLEQVSTSTHCKDDIFYPSSLFKCFFFSFTPPPPPPPPPKRKQKTKTKKHQKNKTIILKHEEAFEYLKTFICVTFMKQFRAEEARWQSQTERLSLNSKKSPSPTGPKPKHTNRSLSSNNLATILDYVASLDVLVGTRSLVSHARAVARRPLIPEDQVKKLLSDKKGKELTKELKEVSRKLALQHQAL
jgi:hypothetical protein